MTKPYCFWSVATGKHAAMMQTLIASARAVGVTEDFHVWTDGKPVEGAIVHESGFFDKHLYLFKLRFLKEQVQKLDYNYFVFIDADCYFTRHPGDVTRLCGDKGIFVQMENEITSGKVKRGDWWSAPIPKLIELMHDMGCEKGSKLYNTNAGFWIVRKDTVDEFYEMAMTYWQEGQKRGYKHFTEEPPLAFCGHVLGDPENMTLAKTADVWVSDWTGQYAGRLPDGKSWQFEDYLNGEKITVNPAIVHAMRSKDAMITAALPKKKPEEPAEHIPTPAAASTLVPANTKVQDKLPVLFLAYGNYAHITLTSIKKIVDLAESQSRLRIIVGMNECGEETVAGLRQLHDEGKIEVLIESKVNRNKDPLMRVMIDLVEEPYFVWFDDDSFPTRKGWDGDALNQINLLHPFDAAGLTYVTNRDTYNGYREFVSKRPWFKSWAVVQEAGDPNLKHSAVFPHGAFWFGRCEYMRQHNFPDRDMVKKCDDMLLGELIAQTKGVMKSSLDCSVSLNTGPRRGTGEEPESGWRGLTRVTAKKFDGLTIYPTGGMVNRLRNIISAIMLCREQKVPLRLVWERSTQTGMVEFKDYWNLPDDVAYESVSTGELMTMHTREMAANNVFRSIPKKNLAGAYHNHWGFCTLGGETVEMEGLGRYIIGLRDNVLPLNAKWQGMVDEFCRANEVSRHIGLHLRAFEFMHGERQPEQIDALVSNFLKRISELSQESFFIATDAKDVQRRILDALQDGQGCLWKSVEQDYLPRDDQTAFEHGLMDFYILGRCKKVFGTKSSTYSHSAGLMAGSLEMIVGARDSDKDWSE